MGRVKSADSPMKRKRKPKDVNKPKRSTSSYFYFLASCRKEAQKQGRSISKIAEFTKECSAKWKVMGPSEKKPFDGQAEEDKARYDREMVIYKGKSGVDPNKPKRPQSAYFLFLADFREKMKGKKVDHKDLLRQAGEEWRGMTPEQKKPYEKKNLEEQKKHEVAMEAYKQKCQSKASAPKKMKQDANGKSEDDDDEDEEEEDDDEEEEEDDDDDDDDE